MRVLSMVPTSYLSWALGHLARLPLPKPLARLSVSLFAQAYAIDHSLATRPIESFRCVGEFFTRDIKPELRPISSGVVCPVDGTLRCCQDLDASGEMLQVKGKSYSLAELLGDAELARSFKDGQAWNFYLSPRDSHHIHSPVDGHIVRTIHVPGKLWPVNDWALNSVDRLFAVNERVVSVIDSDYGRVAVVMVGATNVGRIQVAYAGITTNRRPWAAKEIASIAHPHPIGVRRGEKLGTFMMGSSVLLVCERRVAPAAGVAAPRKVMYGNPLQ